MNRILAQIHALLIHYFRLNIIDCVIGFDFQCDRFAGESFHKYLHFVKFFWCLYYYMIFYE